MALERTAIVCVTYRRQELLQVLFDSFLELNTAPWRIVVADNENSPKTEAMVKAFNEAAKAKWPESEPDALGGTERMLWFPQEKNGGGSGGFSAGTGKAWELGAEWFWLMDDDVAMLPDAFEKMEPWCQKYDVVQGRRINFDGTPFYWQYNFMTGLGIPNPFAPEEFTEDKPFMTMNTACFEGGMFKRNVVAACGLPDPRFFIYWDDTIYGYLASKHATAVVVNEFVLRRTRTIGNWDIAGKRKLNSTSDMNRFHIMRNRGYMARYFMLHGDFKRFRFGLGTVLTMAKEAIRLLKVDKGHFGASMKEIFRGWRASRPILRDPDWHPMPPLQD